jgi:5' nucleotidase, deoxy (Pyrimidine), cytosolic type C protein (NT5C)
MNKVIVLDADGVLLDYNKAYPKAWKIAFGEDLAVKNPSAFYAMNVYGCRFSSVEQSFQFRDAYFSKEFWEDMPPMPGAVDACNRLVNHGYKLICVTKSPSMFKEERVSNFAKYGLPISETHCVENKYEILTKLKPKAFVDDQEENFLGLDSSIHLALIDDDQFDSPNIGKGNSCHASLKEFVDYWLS